MVYKTIALPLCYASKEVRMRILILLLLLFPACKKETEKEDKQEISQIVDTFVRRLGLAETYCSISKENGRCFGRTNSGKVIYFVCDDRIDNCLIYDAIYVPNGSSEQLVESLPWE